MSTSIAALRAADEADPGRRAARAAAAAKGGAGSASSSSTPSAADPGAAAPAFGPELAELRCTLGVRAGRGARTPARFGRLPLEAAPAGGGTGGAPDKSGGAPTAGPPPSSPADPPAQPPGTAPGDAELMRFADAAGLRGAAAPEAAAAALEAAARRVLTAEAWARAGARERGRAARRAGPGLVCWAGTDGAGRPVLAIRAAAALAGGERAVADAAAAVVAAVDAFVRRGGGGGGGGGGDEGAAAPPPDLPRPPPPARPATAAWSPSWTPAARTRRRYRTGGLLHEGRRSGFLNSATVGFREMQTPLDDAFQRFGTSTPGGTCSQAPPGSMFSLLA